jgi:hypothetical protein
MSTAGAYGPKPTLGRVALSGIADKASVYVIS